VAAFFAFGPGTPLIDEKTAPPRKARLTPLLPVAGRRLLPALPAGRLGLWQGAAGTINDHRDLVKMMTDSMGDMAYYLVLAFAAAHFVAMFGWSNLGLILAVHGADALESALCRCRVLLG
jgi:aminobenzoyl-glutamate transport protein